MELTPEEQKQYEALEAKLRAASITTTDVAGNVVSLHALPGGKRDDTPIVQKIREFLKEAETGKYESIIMVGVISANDSADLRWASPGKGMTLKLWGALTRAMHFLHGTG